MPGSDNLLVSIIMPFYNGKRYVREAIKSLMDQTYANTEIIVVDDGSPDMESSEYIEGLSNELGFKLIKHRDNRGIGHALADAFSAASGELIAELSQDDLYKPEKIERQVGELIKKNLDAVYAAGATLCQGNGRIVPPETAKIRKIIDSGHAVDVLRLGNLPCISLQGLLAKRIVFEKDIIPIWRDYLLDDWPVNVRLFERYKVGFMDAPLWTSRGHAGNTSHNIWKWLGPQIEVISRMAPDNLKAEGIGGRLASMARRLGKQNADPDAIIRFALSALVLVESPEQRMKVSRILKRVPSKRKRAMAISKCWILENAAGGERTGDPEKTGDISWQNLGKNIASVISACQGNNRLDGISECFFFSCA